MDKRSNVILIMFFKHFFFSVFQTPFIQFMKQTFWKIWSGFKPILRWCHIKKWNQKDGFYMATYNMTIIIQYSGKVFAPFSITYFLAQVFEIIEF